MFERPQIDRQIHDLVDEANTLVLTMALRGRKDGSKAANVVARLLACADQASAAGKEAGAKHLRQVASMLEREVGESNP